MVCGRDGYSHLQEIKVDLPPDKTLLEVLGGKLKAAVADRVSANLTGATEEDAFRKLVYVLWVPIELSDNAKAPARVPTLKEMEEYMESKRERAKLDWANAESEWNRAKWPKDKAKAERNKTAAEVRERAWAKALRYVRQVYDDNVAVIDAKRIKRLMPPVLQPIATLVSAVTPEEHEEHEEPSVA